MKKTLIFLCIISICISFVACATEKNEDTNSLPTSINSSDDTLEVKANEVIVMGQNITAGTVLSEELLTTFGTANEILSAPSCHFAGEDKIYYYNDFNIYSYTDGDKQIIYLLELVSDKIVLNTGVKIGMSKDETIKLQGTDFTETGVILRYDIDGIYFDLSFDENNNLTLIEILVD